MKKIKVGCSPITNEIYAGNVSPSGMWSINKQDVTDTAPIAVAQHLLQTGEMIIFNYRNEKYVLKVEKYNPTDKPTNN